MIARAALRSRWWTGVGQRLDRRDDDRVAGVDAERVDVLHRADGDARVVGVAHHLVLDLLPADEAALDHDLADRARAQAGADALAVGRLGLDDAAAGPAERERRAGRSPAGRSSASASSAEPSRAAWVAPSTIDAGRVRLADPVEQVAERLAVLGHPDRLERRARAAGSRWRSKTPASASAAARLSAVWPPSPASRPSGRSLAMTASTASTVSGSR